MLDVIGGEILERPTALVRPGGTLVTIAEPVTVHPRDGRPKPITGDVRPLTEAVAAFTPGKRTHRKTIIGVVED